MQEFDSENMGRRDSFKKRQLTEFIFLCFVQAKDTHCAERINKRITDRRSTVTAESRQGTGLLQDQQGTTTDTIERNCLTSSD